jgi:hypothetical protein
MALMAISGIHHPISARPDWVQTVARGFPVGSSVARVREALLRRVA